MSEHGAEFDAPDLDPAEMAEGVDYVVVTPDWPATITLGDLAALHEEAALLAEVRSLLDDPNTPDAAIGRALRAILTRVTPPAVGDAS